jgi:hypothetical protein
MPGCYMFTAPVGYLTVDGLNNRCYNMYKHPTNKC